MWNSLQKWIEAHGSEMSFGSLLSSSDLIVGVLETFSDLVEEEFMLRPAFMQRFLCEKDQTKQKQHYASTSDNEVQNLQQSSCQTLISYVVHRG